MNISWYVKRLLAMSPQEIIFRSLFFVKKKLWEKSAVSRKLFLKCKPIIHWQPDAGEFFFAEQPNCRFLQLIEEADQYLNRIWNFFELHYVSEQNIDWHYDPSTGKKSPSTFSFDLNYRDNAVVGNVKVIWEKNRHHHLTVLSAAYAITKDERYAAEVVRQILDWIEKNPCGIGINWTHGLEMAIRLIAWVWCERLLRSSRHYNELFGTTSPIWLCIGQHQELIARTCSHGSSANNHLIGEMAGLFIASSSFPIYRNSKHWNELSQKVLEQEIVRQTYPSGINRELAFDYHIFVLEFFLLSLYEARKSGIDFSKTFCSIVTKMVEVIPVLTDSGQHLPHYGDGDGGMVVQLQPRSVSRYTWLSQLASFLLKVPCTGDVTLPIALMGLSKDVNNVVTTDTQIAESFTDAGLYVLSYNRNTPQEVFVLADAGPLGYLSIAAHGHADALSFTLSAGAKRLLVDPGTYCYFSDKDMRNYFRRTLAHNTVVVDDKDQSGLQGAFLWSDKAKTTVLEWSPAISGGVLKASHDGYMKRLGVKHTRTIVLEGTFLRITDELSGTGKHSLKLCFHCDPDCIITSETENSLSIVNGSVTAAMKLAEELSVSLHKGEPYAGWFSPHFGVKVPAYTIFAQAHCNLPITFTTTMEVRHGS